MSRIAKEGVLFAYGATEPEAGSDLGALKTIAEPVADDGSVAGYRITGVKQWISNGGVADLYTILAIAPGGPSWFVVDAGTDGLHARRARGQARHPARATRRRCSSTTSTSTPTGSSAASRARGWSRRRRSSATRG